LAHSPRSQAKRLKPTKAPERKPARTAKGSANQAALVKPAGSAKARPSQVVVKAKATVAKAPAAATKKLGAASSMKAAQTKATPSVATRPTTAAAKAQPSAGRVAAKPAKLAVAVAQAAAPKLVTSKAAPSKDAKHGAMNGAAAPAPAQGASSAKPVATPKPKGASKSASAKAAVPAVAAKSAAAEAPPPPKKPARKSIKEAAGVSTDAVARRTGKTWDDWFEVLDNAGAATLDQRGIIAILAQKHGIGPWWQQMIAVGYESIVRKSDKPPAPDGFQINSSCTLDAPLKSVFRLWNDAGERARWLADDRFVVRSTTGEKSIRARWGKGTSQVAVSFVEKSGRTEVSVEHLQIESRDAADQMKAYWAKKLGLLDRALAPRG
jgi:hypothetical protein